MAVLQARGAVVREPLYDDMKKTGQLLIIFVRTPLLGKVKTRLARKIGDSAALKVYLQLLDHVHEVTKDLPFEKEVHFSEAIPEENQWSGFTRKLQQGSDLGERMANAFRMGFQEGYDQIVLIGSDLPELQQKDILEAFSALETSDHAVGPAMDGGYYLIGMKSLNSNIFKNKTWGSSSVLALTLKELNRKKIILLSERRDLDTYEDLKAHPKFRQHLNDNYD